MTIKVRPANNCGTGLANGQTPAIISISRPKPSLTFTGNSTICSQQNFQAFNIPSWVNSLTWQVTPTTVASTGNPNANPVTVQKVSNGLAEIKLTINSAQCGSYEYNTGEIAGPINIAVGIIVPTIQYVAYYGSDVGLTALRIPNATYNWYEGSELTEPGGSNTYQTTVPCNTSKLISVEAVNACGTSVKAKKGVSVKCSAGGTYSLAPNPASSNLTISSTETAFNTIKEVRIIDKGGFMKLYQKYAAGTKKVNVNVSTLPTDVYIVQIFNGKEWQNQQIIIKR